MDIKVGQIYENRFGDKVVVDRLRYDRAMIRHCLSQYRYPVSLEDGKCLFRNYRHGDLIELTHEPTETK